MGSRITSRTQLQAIAVLDERFSFANLSSSLSSYIEASPEPDRAQPGSNQGYMEVDLLAAESLSAQVTYNLQTVNEGPPLGGNRGGRGIQKLSTASDYSGYLNVNKVTGFEIIDLASAGAEQRQKPTAVTTPGHKTIVVYVHIDSSSNESLRAQVRDPSTDTWTSVTILADVYNASKPALIQLPSGRLVCFYTVLQAVGGTNYVRLNQVYSDDDGATWTTGGQHISGFKLDLGTVSPDKLRAVLDPRGYITLTLHDGTTTYHYVSDDFGGSFEQIESFTMEDTELVVDNTGGVILIGTNASAHLVYSRKATPYSRFQDDPSHATTLDSGTVDYNSGDYAVAATVDSEGYLWVFWRNAPSNRGRIYSERYDMATMTVADDEWNSDGLGGNVHPLDTGSNTAYLNEFTAVPHKEGILLIGDWELGVQAEESSLTAIRLGGYSSLDWAMTGFGWVAATVGYQAGTVWFGHIDPTSVGYALTNSGTSSEAVTVDGTTITTTVGQRYYAKTGGTSVPHLEWWENQVASGGSLTASHIATQLTWDNGTTKTHVVVIRRTSTGFSVYDTASGTTQIGVDVTGLTADTKYEFLAYLNEDDFAIWYREAGDQVWTAGPATTTLTNSAAGGTHKVIFGHITSGTTETSKWRWMLSAMNAESTDPDLPNLTLPDDLQGREYSVRPQWLGSGLQMVASGSSSFRGDTWTAATRGRFPASNLDAAIAPSPRDPFKSKDDTTDCIFSWEPEPGLATRMLSSSIAVYLRSNAQTAYWEGSNNGTSWTTLGTLDSTSGLDPASGTLTFQLDGNWLRPASGSATSGQYLQLDELDYVSLVWSGGTATSPGVFAVRRSSEGVWDDAGRQLEALLDDNADTDIATGIGTPTSLELWQKDVTCVIHNQATAYRYYRLRIPAQDTAEGQFIVESFLPGPLLVPGLEYGWGRIVRTEASVESSETRAGRRRRREAAPPRRVAEVAWPDGWSMTQVEAVNPTPDWISANASSAEGIGVRADAYLVERLLSRAKSGELPVVYLPTVGFSPSGAMWDFAVTARDEQLYGFITSTRAVRQNLLGDEGTNELVSLSALVISEEA